MRAWREARWAFAASGGCGAGYSEVTADRAQAESASNLLVQRVPLQLEDDLVSHMRTCSEHSRRESSYFSCSERSVRSYRPAMCRLRWKPAGSHMMHLSPDLMGWNRAAPAVAMRRCEMNTSFLAKWVR
jgi:hypothetical protein